MLSPAVTVASRLIWKAPFRSRLPTKFPTTTTTFRLKKCTKFTSNRKYLFSLNDKPKLRYYCTTPSSHLESEPFSEEQTKSIFTKAEQLSRQALQFTENGKHESAESLLESAIGLRSKAWNAMAEHERQPLLKRFDLETSKMETALAYTKQALGKVDEALKLYEKAIPTVELMYNGSRDHGVALLNYAETLYSSKNSQQAVTIAQEAMKILKTHSMNDELHAVCLANISGYLCSLKRYQEAKPLALEALKLFEKLLGKRNKYTKEAWTNYYCILKELGLKDEADDLETDWKTAQLGGASSSSSKGSNIDDAQMEAIRKKVEERLSAPKKAEPNGTIKDPQFSQKEMKDFMQFMGDQGYDVSDPANEQILKQELAAMKRGKSRSDAVFFKEAEKWAKDAGIYGDNWESVLKELQGIEGTARGIDDALFAQKQSKAADTKQAESVTPKKKPVLSDEMKQTLAKIAEEKKVRKKKKEEEEKAKAEAAAKAAAEASKGKKGKKK